MSSTPRNSQTAEYGQVIKAREFIPAPSELELVGTATIISAP
jgi:hypothetical protein